MKFLEWLSGCESQLKLSWLLSKHDGDEVIILRLVPFLELAVRRSYVVLAVAVIAALLLAVARSGGCFKLSRSRQ